MTADWQELELGNVVVFRNGKSIKSDGKGKYPVYGANGIIGFSDDVLYADAIIIGRVGAYCGAVEYCPRPFWASDNTIVVECRPELADTRFFHYLLTFSELNKYAGGAAQPLLTQSVLKRLVIHVPPIRVQQRIACILSAYDDLIEVNLRRIAILEDMARRLFDEWFVRFRYPGHEAVPLVETELGMVPEGWQIETARQALTYTGGGTPSKAEPSYWHDGDIQWFTPTDLTKSGQTFLRRSSLMITKEGLAKSSARLFPAFSIMMTSRATLGVFAINTEPATTNQGFITFIPSSRTPVYFLFHMLKREFPRMEAVASGATFKEITKGALGELVFPFPPEHLAHRFEQLVTPMMEQIAIISRQNDSLRAARDLLLPKLISGKIDVSVAEETFAEAAE